MHVLVIYIYIVGSIEIMCLLCLKMQQFDFYLQLDLLRIWGQKFLLDPLTQGAIENSLLIISFQQSIFHNVSTFSHGHAYYTHTLFYGNALDLTCKGSKVQVLTIELGNHQSSSTTYVRIVQYLLQIVAFKKTVQSSKLHLFLPNKVLSHIST